MKDRVIAVIFDAFDEVNQLQPDGRKLEKSKDATVLSQLNSLGMVNLIVAIENQIKDKFGVAISLTDEKALLANPFQTTTTLADYITSLLK
jgi:acyl carrier protein